MNRHLLFALPGACLMLLLFACSPPAPSRQKPPNFVIILADDQGWGDLSMNGNPVVQTPTLDQIGQAGLIFDRFYVHAVCSPTRAALLSGRYAVRGGIYSTSAGGERLDLDESTFAEALQQAGYATGAFGKWHNGMQAPYHPNSRGFDEFFGYCSGHWGSYFDAILEHNGEIVQTKGYLTDVLTEKTMDFISAEQSGPFLAYLPLNTPHSPMQVPDRWYAKFDSLALPVHRYSDREKPDHTRAAYAMTKNIDWNVGRIIQHLDSLGLTENTIVMYFSDNGPNGWRWNGGMEGTKGSVDEGGVRSPLILYAPGQVKPGHIKQITSVMDLYPSILEWADIPLQSNHPLDGQSLLPLLAGNDSAFEDRMLVNHWRGKTSVRTSSYRLDQEGKLFDMLADPGQLEDLSSQRPDIFNALDRAARNWEEQVLSELPKEDSRPFVIGHPDAIHTQIPARDGMPHGQIERSNRWPNCSFFTHWTAPTDSISWEVSVAESGDFEVEVYYTLPAETEACNLRISLGESSLESTLNEAFDPPLRGMEHDRILRGESYVKDWKRSTMGVIQLEKGPGTLVLRSPSFSGPQSIDFRLLMLHRLEGR